MTCQSATHSRTIRVASRKNVDAETHLGKNHDAAAIGAVGDDAAEESQRNRRRGKRQTGETEQQRRIGELEHEPALRHAFHVLRQHRGELAEPIEPVIAMAQSAQRLEQALASGTVV